MCWFECLDWKSWTKTVLADVDRADQKLDFNEIQRNFCFALWLGSFEVAFGASLNLFT